jgi:hypothetical protein
MDVPPAPFAARGRSTPDGATHFGDKGSLEEPSIGIAADFLDLLSQLAGQRDRRAASSFGGYSLAGG